MIGTADVEVETCLREQPRHLVGDSCAEPLTRKRHAVGKPPDPGR
jgi:hypothetical protein